MMRFKQTALVAALALATASPLATAAQTGGVDAFVSGALGTGSTDYKDTFVGTYWNESDKQDLDNTFGKYRATLNYTDKSGFGGQMDYVYATDKHDWFDSATTDIVGHAFYRGNDWLLGALAQRRTFNINDGSDYPLPMTLTVMGVEAQKQFGANTSVYAQLGRQNLNDDSWKLGGWIASVEGRYFLNDNLLVNGKLTSGAVKDSSSGCCSYSGEDKIKTTTLELGGEYRLPNTVFSVFGTYAWIKDGYQYSYSNNGGYFYEGKTEYTTHQFMVGVKLNLGKDSLRQRDREGASLNPMSVMGGNTAYEIW
ncbi:MAG: hypothetical protein B7X93_09025 [Hydrogenophilales bacterium 17-61-9]|nr:MAG: hypothetical protein B7X93_09025 [Hydrogenophilales bacterium 17-61-9]